MAYASALHRIHTLISRELGWDDSRIAAMFAGHSPATRAAAESLSDLRTRIRSTEGAGSALEARPGDPIGALESIDPDLAESLQRWKTTHGWAMVNYDAGIPVLAERPTMLTTLILTEPSPIDFDDAQATAAEARSAIAPQRREEFDVALAAARTIYPLREDNTIVVGDRPMALLRRWMLEVARTPRGAGRHRVAERCVIPHTGRTSGRARHAHRTPAGWPRCWH